MVNKKQVTNDKNQEETLNGTTTDEKRYWGVPSRRHEALSRFCENERATLTVTWLGRKLRLVWRMKRQIYRPCT
jgi:hypothetical protein